MQISLTKYSDSHLFIPSDIRVNTTPRNRSFIHAIDKYIQNINFDVYPFNQKLPEITKEVFQAYGLPLSLNSCIYQKCGQKRKLFGSSTKTLKGQNKGVKTAVLYLSAADRSGYNLCVFSSVICRLLCLGHTSGRMGQVWKTKEEYKQTHIVNDQQLSQFLKTVWFLNHPVSFLRQLIMEIIDHAMKTRLKDGDREWESAIRLNGTSDLDWWRYLDIDALNEDWGVSFYDYTKRPVVPNDLPKSYHLTYSISEIRNSWKRAAIWMKAGYSAALVVGSKDNDSYEAQKQAQKMIVDFGHFHINGYDYEVINGDLDDLRYLDGVDHNGIGRLVTLYVKGQEKEIHRIKDSGFVYRV